MSAERLGEPVGMEPNRSGRLRKCPFVGDLGDAVETLSTVAETLDRALDHHRRRDEHEADLANRPRVQWSPITLALAEALDTVRGLCDDAASA